jgi:3'-phosphoadenosine 5'-phosphosulfate sulfotransferase (PAPS reductase)/FAD synthetase
MGRGQRKGDCRVSRTALPAGQDALFADDGLRPAAPVPDLRRYRWIVANISGGKDSQVALDELVRVLQAQGVPRARVVTVFCDLGSADEWPGTRELAAEHAARYGLRHEVVCRQVSDGRGGTRQQGLFGHIIARGLWPDAMRRYCTSDLKRAPVYRLLTRLAAEARAEGCAGPVPILNVMGLRAEESPRRALMAPFSRDERASNSRRHVDEWLPVHSWTRRQVWQRIRETGARYHPVYHLGMPRLSCRFCLAGETEVVTREGLRPIRDLAGGGHSLLIPHQSAYGIRGYGAFAEAEVRSFGVQPLMRITMHRGRQHRTVYATAEHRWLALETKPSSRRPDGRLNGYERVTCERTTAQLTPGTELRSVKAQPPVKTGMVRFAVAQGFVYGDGNLAGGDRPAELHIYDHGKDGALLPFFAGHQVRTVTNKGKPVSVIYGLPRLWKERPDLRESRSFLLSWLAGYFAADGCVTPDGSARISSASPESMQVVRDIAAICGIGSGPVRTEAREGFPGRAKTALHTLTLIAADLPGWFFVIKAHQQRIAARTSTRTTYERRWAVDAVVPTSRREEVFCAVVPGVQAFALSEDLMTGNCVLASEAALVLAARLDPEGARLRARAEDQMALRKITATYAIAATAGTAAWPGRQAPVLLKRIWRAGHLFRQGLSMHDVIAKAEALGPVGTTVGEWRGAVPPEQWIENVEDLQTIEDWVA